MTNVPKTYTCTLNVYSIRKSPTSAVTTAFTELKIEKYQKDMGTKMKNDSSTRAWYVIYQIYTTISKIYKGIQRLTCMK